MKYAITILAFFLTSVSFAQDSTQLEVIATIDNFFEGFHSGDTALMQSVLMDKVFVQSAYRSKQGEDVLVTDDIADLLHAIANRPEDQKWDERLLEYSVQVDGNMANAWTPYEFWFNGKFHHCGVNSFQLFHDNGTWKIIYLIDTKRIATCNPAEE